MTGREPLRVLVAPDAFKGSLSARDAADAIAAGLADALGAGARIERLPLADGGEGTLDALLALDGATEHRTPTTDALGRPRVARWALLPDGTAVVEAAEANGLPLVTDVALRPLEADSAGVGLLLRAALDARAARVLLTVGGSATTDGGAGLLRALGARFLDAHGAELPPGGGALVDLARVELDALHPAARAVPWRVACDVDTPLTGPAGAAAVFGPQKGADSEQVRILDRGLARLAAALDGATGVQAARLPGGGAAGGIPASLHAVLGTELVPGARLVADALGLEEALARADVIVTGEGALDASSLRGKVVGHLAERARAARVPLVVVAGSVRITAEERDSAGIADAVALDEGGDPLAELMAQAGARIRAAAREMGERLR
ncbi:glycerate kinase [Yonghaparkia sp. Root332]|uniref:glycerate kinase family protein n=1 Tax=Yonghaparkia sp. Root332 TaxID=1736516 RepID=UPI0006F330D1|nr:glycerate kinase [Yonghaparkia sp. Root332]KQV26765.1 hypothetical protein ASC54_01920 [Yonghaparkia sp. Root332]